MEEIVEKKKLSWNIERTDVQGFNCKYNYKFSTPQWLESVDNPEYFGISHNDMKEKVIENLVSEFRIALNNVIFGDPAGREYVEHLENSKQK
jgi:hypothetical protein